MIPFEQLTDQLSPLGVRSGLSSGYSSAKGISVLKPDYCCLVANGCESEGDFWSV
jgi:hypothetical protein